MTDRCKGCGAGRGCTGFDPCSCCSKCRNCGEAHGPAVAPFQIPPPVYIPYPVYSPIVHPIYGEPRWVPTEYIWCGTTTPDPEMLARFHAGKNAADYSTIYYDGNSYRAGIQ